MLMHGMVPIKSSARCWKNNDACWYAIYLSATCKCWEISVCVCVYSICMFRLFSCTCDSISHSKIVSPNHFLPTYKNRSLDAGCVQWSSRWTLIRQFNFYLFSFNWIALINVSSAFIDENEKKESEALILFLPLTLSHPIVRFLHLNSKCVCCFSVVVVRIKFQTKLALKRAKNRMRSI